MGNVKKEDRADGTEILKLNLVGLGLQAIGEIVGCHEATVSVKLKEMGVAPNDTRRNFMGEVYNCLTEEEREWLADTLYTSKVPIRDFVLGLLRRAYITRDPDPVPEVTPLPEPEPFSLTPTVEVPRETLTDLFTQGVGVTKTTVEDGEVKVTPVPVKDLFSE